MQACSEMASWAVTKRRVVGAQGVVEVAQTPNVGTRVVAGMDESWFVAKGVENQKRQQRPTQVEKMVPTWV